MRLSDRVKYGVRYSEYVRKLKMKFLIIELNINIITVSLECFSEKFLSQLNDKSLRKTLKMGNPFIPLFDPPNTTHLYFLFLVPCPLSLVTCHFSLFTFHFSLFTFHFSLFTFHFSLVGILLQSWSLGHSARVQKKVNM